MNTAISAPSVTPTPLTIRDLESSMEGALDRLRLISSETSPQEAFRLLIELRSLFTPVKYRVAVQLEEDGRKKRSTAASTNWNPVSGEIVLYFEPSASDEPQYPISPDDVSEASHIRPAEGQVLSLFEREIKQCSDALADAERAGKHFVALKWFRDLVLPGLPYSWARSEEGRQRTLSQAIESGAILTKKIPNPKYPAFPTTTISLNRTADAPVHVKSRFNPVPIKGEPASVTLLRDRGSY